MKNPLRDPRVGVPAAIFILCEIISVVCYMIFFATTDPCAADNYTSGLNETVTEQFYTYDSFSERNQTIGLSHCNMALQSKVDSTVMIFGLARSTVEWITKPIPQAFIIFNAILFFVFFKHYKNPTQICILIANILGVTGDLLIIPSSFFLGGFAVFAFVHIAYIVGFSLPSKSPWEKVPLNLIFLLPVLVLTLPPFIWLLYSMVINEVSVSWVVSVAIYGALEISSIWRVLARIGYPAENFISHVVALLGIVLFVASDLVLATDSFLVVVYLARVWVLGLYWLSNTLIVFSMMVPWGDSVGDDEVELKGDYHIF